MVTAHIDEEIASIGIKVRKLRINAGYSAYYSFAYAYELSPRHYWSLESGKANVSLGFLLKVLRAHDLTLKEFFEI